MTERIKRSIGIIDGPCWRYTRQESNQLILMFDEIFAGRTPEVEYKATLNDETRFANMKHKFTKASLKIIFKCCNNTKILTFNSLQVCIICI